MDTSIKFLSGLQKQMNRDRIFFKFPKNARGVCCLANSRRNTRTRAHRAFDARSSRRNS